MALKLIIDTDPGIDDAMAILYAIAAPEIDLLGSDDGVWQCDHPQSHAQCAVFAGTGGGSRSLWPKGCTALVYFLPFRQPLRCMGRRALGTLAVPTPPAPRAG